MSHSIPLTVVFEAVEGGWTQARIVEIPAVITAAPSREEARTMVVDALREFLLSHRDESDLVVDGEREALAITISP